LPPDAFPAPPMAPPPPASTTPTPRAEQERSALLSQTLSVIAAVAGLTATRILLLLAVAGAFYLATRAIDAQNLAPLCVLVAYCVLTVLPLVALDWATRKRVA
jgi:hypothetical protein